MTKSYFKDSEDSQCNGVCRILSTGKPSLFRGSHRDWDKRVSAGFQPGKIFKFAASQPPPKICRAAAVGKIATCRLIRRIISESVVNASSHRRRGLYENEWTWSLELNRGRSYTYQDRANCQPLRYIRRWRWISRKSLEIETWFQKRLGTIGNGMWAIKWSRDRWRHLTPKGVVTLWGITVGYPSDSLASCWIFLNCIKQQNNP